LSNRKKSESQSSNSAGGGVADPWGPKKRQPGKRKRPAKKETEAEKQLKLEKSKKLRTRKAIQRRQSQIDEANKQKEVVAEAREVAVGDALFEEGARLNVMEKERYRIMRGHYVGISEVDVDKCIGSMGPYLLRKVRQTKVDSIKIDIKANRMTQTGVLSTMMVFLKEAVLDLGQEMWDPTDLKNYDLNTVCSVVEARSIMDGAPVTSIDRAQDKMRLMVTGGNHWLTAYNQVCKEIVGFEKGFPRPRADVYTLMSATDCARLANEHNEVRFCFENLQC
jgi:hypothetical protein